jgi:hypothetical protein
MKNVLPLARFEGIVVQELMDEVLVCDLKSNKVFCLNQTAGEIWKLCDGKLSITEISALLSRKLKTSITDELVLFSLDELYHHNLLVKRASTPRLFFGVSRREVIKRIGLSTMAALPIVTAVTMPTAAQAQSGCPAAGSGDPIPNNCPCLDCSECDSGCCFMGVCSSFASCNTAVTCGATQPTCPSGFVCCNPANPTNSATCSACGC